MNSSDVVLILVSAIGFISTAAVGIAGWALLKVITLGEEVSALKAENKGLVKRMDELKEELVNANSKLDRLLSGHSRAE